MESIYKKLKEKYGRIENVREILDNKLIDSESIKFLKEIRNSAAHARLGQQVEITRDDINKIIDHLVFIIHNLNLIAASISASRISK